MKTHEETVKESEPQSQTWSNDRPRMCRRITDTFLQLFCEKNSDGTKNLRLKGKDIEQRTGARFISEDMYRITKFAIAHPEIVQINLCHNEIGDEGFTFFCKEYLGFENNLEVLNVMSCNITQTGMKSLADVVDTLKLKVLRLAGNRLFENGGCLAAFVLSKLPTLKYFDVGDTEQTFESVEKILMTAAFTKLEVLNISRIIARHFMYQYDCKHIIENIAELLRLSKTIREIHAQKIGFDGHDIEILIKFGLTTNETLLFLDLGYNNIGNHGIELLMQWIRTHPNLIALNVAGNNISNYGAISISFHLPFSKIRLLDLSYNKIPDEGMMAILNSIKKPYQIRHFYFWGNLFGHPTNAIINRLLCATVLQQDIIDVKPYCVDGIWFSARYPADHYKHRYYEVMDYGTPVELLIKRNKVEPQDSQPRVLVKFEHIDRFPKWIPDMQKPY